MLPDDVEWQESPGVVQLVHRGWPVAEIRQREEGVEVTTRPYVQGYRPARQMATVEGARRYVEAWWGRWESQVRQEVAAKLRSPNELAWPEGYEPPVYPDIQVVPRRPRRRR